MGTRFCATQEAPIHDKVKQLLVENDERGTNLIFRSLHKTARIGRTSVSDGVVEILARPGSVFDDVAPIVRGAQRRIGLEQGDLDAGLVWASQIQGLIHDIPTCAVLIGRIMGEAHGIISGRPARLATTVDA